MGKSTEELRRILQRMQQDLETKGPVEPGARSPETPRPEPVVSRPFQPVRARLEPVRRVERELPEEAPEPFEEERQSWRLEIPWRRAALWTCVFAGAAAVCLRNLWTLAAAFAGLMVCIFLSSGEETPESGDIEELTRRVAALERYLSSRTLPAGSGSVSREVAEEVQELRTMIKSLYRVLQQEHDEEFGIHGESRSKHEKDAD